MAKGAEPRNRKARRLQGGGGGDSFRFFERVFPRTPAMLPSIRITPRKMSRKGAIKPQKPLNEAP